MHPGTAVSLRFPYCPPLIKTKQFLFLDHAVLQNWGFSSFEQQSSLFATLSRKIPNASMAGSGDDCGKRPADVDEYLIRPLRCRLTEMG